MADRARMKKKSMMLILKWAAHDLMLQANEGSSTWTSSMTACSRLSSNLLVLLFLH